MRLARQRSLAALALMAVIAVVAAGCGREHEPVLVNGKAQFVQKCSSCHVLGRANAQGKTGPNLDESFEVALRDGMNQETVAGVVRRQIANVRRSSEMPADLVTGNDAADVAAYVASVVGKTGQDGGALATAGLAGATTGEAIFRGAGCGSCHTLGRAGASGTIGPNLNELAQEAGKRQPGMSPEDYVNEAIAKPNAFAAPGFSKGAMPSFAEQLDEKQLKLLTDYLLEQGK